MMVNMNYEKVTRYLILNAHTKPIMNSISQMGKLRHIKFK